ncbi:hypothetical protein [Bacillus sp. FJAT-26390]|uniref:hypothetical protein n=1 Tax=Bacillus sp. FJAT-26390 TaxID=1743142 RepID=UPI000807B98D|nr:hypothetical protein [Bacillus sp. FJAT-26390]OBZ13445.1 hypothetical protein A7975_11475 [Bacillus sp. FJAT-26390]
MSGNIKINFSKREYSLLLIILFISLLQFSYFVSQNSVASYYDEIRYFEIGKNILSNGLFNIADDLRTYLYPLLISIFYIFTDGQSVTVKIIFSVFQYVIYVITIAMIAKASYKYHSNKIVYFTVFALGMLNPYLIQSTTLFLTDVLATCLLIISLLYLLTSDLNKFTNGIVVSSLLYCAVLIRPSSAIFMLLFFLIGLYRFIYVKDFKPAKFTFVGLLLLLVFLPQLYMNITKFNHFTPLIHLNLLEQQSVWATQHLKYSTVVIDGEHPALRYITPWAMDSNISMMKLMSTNFIVFLAVFVSHIFGVIDWGYVDTYIRDLSVSSRIFPSILLYTQWFIIGLGILWIKLHRKWTFMTISLLFSAIGYTLFIATTAIESRFGYPIYLILLLFSGFGVQYILENIKNKKKTLYIFSSLLVFICISFYFSYFIDMQTGRISWFD